MFSVGRATVSECELTLHHRGLGAQLPGRHRRHLPHHLSPNLVEAALRCDPRRQYSRQRRVSNRHNDHALAAFLHRRNRARNAPFDGPGCSDKGLQGEP